MNDDLVLAPAPHVGAEQSVTSIMYDVIYSLMPAGLVAIYFFGPRALALIVGCVAAAVATEAVFQRARGRKVTAFDGSAIITGILLALTLPPSFPIYLAVLGSVVAIGLGKQIFGGLGQNIFNPALVGRAFLQAAFPVMMAKWTQPLVWLSGKVDAASSATPLMLAKFDGEPTPYIKLLLGNVGGSLGETSAVALLLGAAYLYYKGLIEWRIPFSFLGSVAVLSGAFWLIDGPRYPDPLFHLLAGGLILGAFFMATDYVTSPITPNGKLIFGIGCGLLLVVIRLFGGIQEGVMYSILLMNALTPLINRYTQPTVYGAGGLS